MESFESEDDHFSTNAVCFVSSTNMYHWLSTGARFHARTIAEHEPSAVAVRSGTDTLRSSSTPPMDYASKSKLVVSTSIHHANNDRQCLRFGRDVQRRKDDSSDLGSIYFFWMSKVDNKKFNDKEGVFSFSCEKQFILAPLTPSNELWEPKLRPETKPCKK